MAITYLGEVIGGTSSSSSSFNVSLASLGLQQDDLVIVWHGLSHNSGSRTVGTSTSGFTDVHAKLSSNDLQDAVAIAQYKFMGPTPDSSLTMVAAGSSGGASKVIVRAYRGVDLTTPLDGVTVLTRSAQLNTLLVDLPALTPNTAGALIIACGCGARTQAFSDLYTSSDLSDFTSDIQNATSYGVVIGVGHYSWSSGAFDPAQWSNAGNTVNDNSWVGSIFCLKPAAGGGSYSLAADAGSFTEAGQAVTLRADRKLAAAAGSYTLDGQAVGLRADRRIAAAAGSFTLSGQDVTLLGPSTGYILAAGVGAFVLSGQAAALRAGRRVAVAAGAFTETGQAVTLRADRRLAAATGAFALAGQAALLRAARRIGLEVGVFTLAGQQVVLAYSGTPVAPIMGSFGNPSRRPGGWGGGLIQRTQGGRVLSAGAITGKIIGDGQ